MKIIIKLDACNGKHSLWKLIDMFFVWCGIIVVIWYIFWSVQKVEYIILFKSI